MTNRVPPATMAENIHGIPDNLIVGHVFNTFTVNASPADNIQELRRAGRSFLQVQQTCHRFHELWNRQIITEHGDGKWLFVRYDNQVVIYEVKTLHLPMGNGDSGIERMRIRLQEMCTECIENWKHFQEGMWLNMEKTKAEDRKKMRNIIKSSEHLNMIGKAMEVRGKINSRVALVDFEGEIHGLREDWMGNQIKVIVARREAVADMGMWSRLAMNWTTPPTKTRGEAMLANLDTTGIRTRLLEMESFKGESLVITLLGNTSYATLCDVLEATIPPGMTYLDSNNWWETGVL